MRCRKIALLGWTVLTLVGCSHCGGANNWWSRLTSREKQPDCASCGVPANCGAPMMMAPPMAAGLGCAECGSGGYVAGMPEGEPILTAPQKLVAEPKRDVPGYAEPMPFAPKKP